MKGKTIKTTTIRKAVICSDHHVPFHNEDLHQRFLQFLKRFRPDDFIVLGDMCDMYSLGSYHQNSLYYLRDMTLSDEYTAANNMLDDYDRALRKASKTFLWGNHCDRFWRYIKTGDNAKLGEELISPTSALNLTARGYVVYDDWKNDSINLGPLTLFHGDSVAINSANVMLTKTFRSIAYGHTHRPQTFVRSDSVGLAIGCMCDIDSTGMSYMPRIQRDSWRNGFLIVYYNECDFLFENVICNNDGSFVAGGIVY